MRPRRRHGRLAVVSTNPKEAVVPETLSRAQTSSSVFDSQVLLTNETPVLADDRSRKVIEFITDEPAPSRRRRWANELLLHTLTDETTDPEIAFFCECSDTACHSPVWLTAGAFADRVANGEPILLDQHPAP
jgi:hypothetical protein